MTPDEAPTTTSASELTDARLVAAMREGREIRKATVDATAALVVQILLLRSRGWSAKGGFFTVTDTERGRRSPAPSCPGNNQPER